MGRIKKIWLPAWNLFLYERTELRTVMGFLVGMAAPFYWLKIFLMYAVSRGEPVNILEAFIIIEQESGGILFLVPGWLLVISDAPFVNGNTCYCLLRTGKRNWNAAMFLYLILQAAVYTVLVSLPTVLFSLPYGFAGKLWSSPVYALAKGYGMKDMEERLFFHRIEMMGRLNVPQAFFLTMLFFFVYLVLMGVILYTVNLFFGGISGMAVTLFLHIGGGLLRSWGIMGISLSEYAVAAGFVTGQEILWYPVCIMALLTGICMLLQYLYYGTAEYETNIRGKQ